MLKNADFRQRLAEVNVFVASHHGRENGYCEEVFQYCKPEGDETAKAASMVRTHAAQDLSNRLEALCPEQTGARQQHANRRYNQEKASGLRR